MRRMRYTGPTPAVNEDVTAELGPEGALETDKSYDVSDDLAERLEQSSQHWEDAGVENPDLTKKELLQLANELDVEGVNSRTTKAQLQALVTAAKATAGAGEPDQPGEEPEGGEAEAARERAAESGEAVNG